MRRTFLFLGLCAAFILLGMHPAKAATMTLTLDKNTVGIGDSFEATLHVESQDTAINAAQATVSFPKDLVEMTNLDTKDSVFDFWLENPPTSDKTGSFSFLGGSTNGYKGKSLLVWHATFRVKGSGPITLALSDAAISASDGSGTNVLSEVQSAFIASVPKTSTREQAPIAQIVPTSTTPIAPPVLIPTPPVQIKRIPAPASDTPVTPELSVSLYPDPNAWYNVQANFLASWDIPGDVSNVATALDQNPTTNPDKSEGLFNNKIFPAPKQGISYLHIRFKNAKGWGRTIHYRLGIDTTPPSGFAALIEEGALTDTPTPTLTYRSNDSTSGLEQYLIHIDNQEPIKTLDERIVLPILLPGKHLIRVEAIDKARNSTEASTEVTISALPSPILGQINTQLYIGEGGLSLSGGGMSSSTLVLSLKKASGELVETQELTTDTLGNWSTVFNQPLLKGQYYIEAMTRDERGATSLVVKSAMVSVRTRPFLVLAGHEVTETVFFIFIIVLLLLGFVFGWITNSLRKRQRAWRSLISQRDILDVLTSVSEYTETILKKFKKEHLGERQALETKQLLLRMEKKVKTAKSYLLRGIDDLNN